MKKSDFPALFFVQHLFNFLIYFINLNLNARPLLHNASTTSSYFLLYHVPHYKIRNAWL